MQEIYLHSLLDQEMNSVGGQGSSPLPHTGLLPPDGEHLLLLGGGRVRSGDGTTAPPWVGQQLLRPELARKHTFLYKFRKANKRGGGGGGGCWARTIFYVAMASLIIIFLEGTFF